MCFNVANLDCFLFKSKKIIKIMTQFKQITAVYYLTKLNLSMSKSWLTPEYFFFVSLLRRCYRPTGMS